METTAVMIILGVLLCVSLVFLIKKSLEATEAKKSIATIQDECRKTLTKKDAEMKKMSEVRQQATEELKSAKEEIKELKQKRYEERDAAKTKKELELAKEAIERELSGRIAKAQENAAAAEEGLAKARKEISSLQAKKTAAEKALVDLRREVEKAAAASATPQVSTGPSPEEKARIERLAKAESALELSRKNLTHSKEELDIAKRDMARMRRERDDLAEQVKRLKGKESATQKSYLVQKGECEVAKERFRSLESRYNKLVLEKDEIGLKLFRLEKQMKALAPVTEEVQKATETAPVAEAVPAADASSEAKAE